MKTLNLLGIGTALLTTLLTPKAMATDIFFDPIETKHWQIINDNVMGGLSQSRFYHEDDYGVFEGDVSLENNGGFASIRRVISPEFSDRSVIRLIVKGDGRKYQLRMKTHRLYEGAAYVAEFETDAETWQVITFKEQDFTARFRGRYISDAPNLKFGDAVTVGFLINDKRSGEFQLKVKAIEVLSST